MSLGANGSIDNHWCYKQEAYDGRFSTTIYFGFHDSQWYYFKNNQWHPINEEYYPTHTQNIRDIERRYYLD